MLTGTQARREVRFTQSGKKEGKKKRKKNKRKERNTSAISILSLFTTELFEKPLKRDNGPRVARRIIN